MISNIACNRQILSIYSKQIKHDNKSSQHSILETYKEQHFKVVKIGKIIFKYLIKCKRLKSPEYI